MIRIRSKKDGFRRCGIAHSAEWTEYPDDRFTKKELERLRAEPMLQVEVKLDPNPPGAKAGQLMYIENETQPEGSQLEPGKAKGKTKG